MFHETQHFNGKGPQSGATLTLGVNMAQTPGKCDPRKGRYEADGDMGELGLANVLRLASVVRGSLDKVSEELSPLTFPKTRTVPGNSKR